MSVISRFCRDETGASAIEYGLIAGMVACVVINALQTIGARMGAKFITVKNALS